MYSKRGEKKSKRTGIAEGVGLWKGLAEGDPRRDEKESNRGA